MKGSQEFEDMVLRDLIVSTHAFPNPFFSPGQGTTIILVSSKESGLPDEDGWTRLDHSKMAVK
jgi:hypothetical protein